MKLFVICSLLLILAISSTIAAPRGNGRPGCATSQEIHTRFYRNFWDPTAYWVCSELRKPASAARCQDEEAFMDSLRKCVPWNDWHWETIKSPPSSAAH
ncbi:uncharacterized protein LOC129942433 [Eupeodes corollae]|uniref:uncharacterized protein LOC129942433 n=1 Tax=Eupeodes corollae TaxID=290404 RepID=UPI002492CD77|nr:uncharacterized protein LOC129942433 [Eupeodes corollae]